MSKRVLVLWNQTGDDIYEQWKREAPSVPWDPEERIQDLGTVQEEMDALLAGLRDAGYTVQCVNAADDLHRVMSAIHLFQPHVVFNLVEYFHEDEGLEASVAALYELLGVEYTGNRPGTLVTCQNKVRTKMLLAGSGLPTAPFMVVHTTDVPRPEDRGLRYPLIVKPALEDASGGIEASSVVQTYEQLVDRVRHVVEYFEQPALVEHYIDGREIHAAVLGTDDPRVLPLFEMAFDDSDFREEGDDAWRPQIISYSAKWDPTAEAFYSMEAVCPAEVEPALAERIRRIAVEAFRVMECRDYARIDMRVDAEGNPYILEVNPNPDLAVDGAFETCARAGGFSYPQLLGAIVESALSRVPDEPPAEEPATTTDHMWLRHGDGSDEPERHEDAA